MSNEGTRIIECVCVILTNQHEQILGVSRKDRLTDFNFIGGKVEQTDETIEAAAIREAKEETGLDIFNLRLVDTRTYQGQICHLFFADYNPEQEFFTQRESDERGEGHVEWCYSWELFNSKFGDYNKDVIVKYVYCHKDREYTICPGDQFLCIKNYRMDDNSIAYTKGNIYTAEHFNCITDDDGIKDHEMKKKDNNHGDGGFFAYFTDITEHTNPSSLVIKNKCEALYKTIREAQDKLEDIRKTFPHENTVEGNYSWRPGVLQPAIICDDCGHCVEIIDSAQTFKTINKKD